MRSTLSILAIGIIFLFVWMAIYPTPPHMPTSDLFTHLSVARHLVEGQGFRTDVVYPVSLAYDFARELPQPLIHRAPGYAVLLVGPYLLAGGDTHATLRWVHRLHDLLFQLLVVMGLFAARRSGRPEAGGAWLVLLAGAPAFAYAAGWNEIEILIAPLFFAFWHLAPRAVRAGPVAALGYGAATGILFLIRQDLFWIPLFWWAMRSWTDIHDSGPPRRRRWVRPILHGLLVVMAWAAVIAPWHVRNYRLTGDPFFALQTRAEHLKMSRDWPGYSIYRSLSPEPVFTTLRENPGLMLNKTAKGVRFYTSHIGRWMSWTALIGGGILALVRLSRRRRSGASRAELVADPTVLAIMTLGIMVLQYVPFSHTIRHLLPIWPVIAWRICQEGAMALAASPRLGQPARTALLAGAAALSVWLTPARLPGWEHAARIASREAALVQAAVMRADGLPPGPVFSDTSIVLWHANRTGVWSPNSDRVEEEIRRLVPELTNAPWLTLVPDRMHRPPRRP